MPALRGEKRVDEARELVAIELVDVKRIDVVRASVYSGRLGDDRTSTPSGRSTPRELGQHPRLIGRLQVLDRLERHDDVDTCVGQRQLGGRAFDEFDIGVPGVRRARVCKRPCVDVDAGHVNGGVGEQRTAIPLATRHIQHASARDERARERVAMPVLVGNFAGGARHVAFAGEFEVGAHVRGIGARRARAP